MKTNRILAFLAIAIALSVIVGQSFSRPAAAHNIQASISTQVSKPAKQTASQTSQQPNDQTPYFFTIQGRLTNANGQPITADTQVIFSLYTQSSGGSAFYSEDNNITPDQNGLFTYQIQPYDSSVLDDNAKYAGAVYLGIKVGNDPEMTPRTQLTAAPYAMSLAPGALISGDLQSNASHVGILNVTNTGGAGTHYAMNVDNSSTGGTQGYGIHVNNHGGGSGSQEGLYIENYSTNGDAGSAAQFVNYGGGSGEQAGITVSNSSVGGTSGYGGSFYNNGGGTGPQYGVSATATGVGAADTVGGDFGVVGSGNGAWFGVLSRIADGNPNNETYGGFFKNSNTGSGTNYGIYAYAPAQPGGYSGYFDSDSATAYSVHVKGKVQATNGCCTSPNYDVPVVYHGSEPLSIGDTLAADGINATIDGMPTLGVVKADSNNAKAVIGVVQYRLKAIGKAQDGSDNHQVDTAATSFQKGDLLSAVVIGQVRMKVGKATIGDRLTLGNAGLIISTDDSKPSIGKVVGLPDNDGFATVFVNVK